MLHSMTNSQALRPDGQVSFRLVNRGRYWQARDGRTFPVIAGGSDEPPSGDNDQDRSGEGNQEDDAGADPQIAKLRRENARYRTELRQAQSQLTELADEKRKRDDAEKSETEKALARAEELTKAHQEATKKAEAAEAKLRQVQIDRAIEQAAQKLNARNPSVVAKLLDRDALELDDDGAPTNAEELVKKLLKDEPYLVNGTTEGRTTTGVPATPRAGAPAGHAEKVKENEEKLIATRQYNPIG